MYRKLIKGQRFFEENMVFFLFMCIQGVVLIYLVASLFSEKIVLEIPLENGTEKFGYIENLTDEVKSAEFSSGSCSIQPGAYKVFVKYSSQKSIVNPGNSLNDIVATITFGSARNPSAVKMNNIILDDGHTNVDERLWIDSYSQLKDFTMRLFYHGEGKIQVEGVVVKEQIIYRYVRIIEFMLILGLLDFLYIVLWGKGVEISIYKKKVVIGLIVMILIATLPAFADFIFVGHDIYFHMQRIVSVAEELENRQFPVRMMSNMLNGYGYANSLFYCDIFLYLPALLYNLMLPLRTCYQIYLFFINVVTCCIGYFAFSRMAQSKEVGLIGTALYLFASYRLINVHIRESVGEYTAMCFLPLVIYGIWRIYGKEKLTWKDWLPLAIAISAIVQCHILTVEIVIMFSCLYALINLNKTLVLGRVCALAKAAAVALGISAWFVIPLLESMYCMPINVNGQMNKIQTTGLYPIQMFGMFMHGSGSNIWGGMSGEMPLSIGITLVAGIVISAYVCTQRKKWKLEQNRQYKVLRTSFLFGMGALLLTLECFPYDDVENLFGTKVAEVIGVIQFSWRYLSAATALLSVAIVMALVVLRNMQPKVYKMSVGILICSQVLSVGIFYWQYSYAASEDSFHSQKKTMEIGMGEYLLKGTDKAQAAIADCEIISGDVIINNYQKVDGKIKIDCKNIGDTEAKILLPVFNYDNYQMYDVKTGEEQLIETGYNNRIQVSVIAGYEGVLELSYVPPLLWRITEIVSLVVVITIIAVLIQEYGRRDMPIKKYKIPLFRAGNK